MRRFSCKWLLLCSALMLGMLAPSSGITPATEPVPMRVEGERATFTTKAMIAVVEKGTITRLYNRLTRTEYVFPSPAAVPRDFATGLVYVTPGVVERRETPNVIGATPTEAASKVLLPKPMPLSEFPRVNTTKVDERTVEFLFQSEDGQTSLRMNFSLDPNTGDLLVRQKGTGNRQGLSGIRFGLGGIVCNGNLLLPSFNGIKASRGKSFMPFESASWSWPTGWQFPLALFQDILGGFWVHAQDPEGHFKSLSYQYADNGTWNVAFDTINQAPFPPRVAAESVTWRINMYAGDWTVPVDRYKAWAYQAYGMAGKQRFRPAWVDDIRLVIKHADYIPDDQIVPYLDRLQKLVDPRKTLLFMTNWEEYLAAQVPHWVANPKGIKFNQEARNRGFRTMYFANYIGITPNHPEFERFKPYFIKNPYTGDIEGWNLKAEWSVETPIQLYYVSPAAKAWRDYQIGAFKALLEKYPADGLFIDQSFLMFNDGNGLVDGQNTVQGNLAYHRELAEAIPGVAIGGEGVNEITMQYQSFCELHPLGLHVEIDGQGKSLGWQVTPAAFDRIVPLVSRYILPHTRPIGYLAFPETSSPFYTGWRDSLHIYSGIPTITRPSMADLEDADSEVRHVMREAMEQK
jgi:hypothetical protein